MKGIFGKKICMSQSFDEIGRISPITEVRIFNHKPIKKMSNGKVLVAIKGIGSRKKMRNNSYKGILKQNGIESQGNECFSLKEIAPFHNNMSSDSEFFTNVFENGDIVDVTGTTKGKGFTGVMKKHGFHGLGATHGVSLKHRSAGAVQACQDPGKTDKFKKMAGRDGGDVVVQRGLKVLEVRDNGVLLIQGTFPGNNNTIVSIRLSSKGKKTKK